MIVLVAAAAIAVWIVVGAVVAHLFGRRMSSRSMRELEAGAQLANLGVVSPSHVTVIPLPAPVLDPDDWRFGEWQESPPRSSAP